MPKYQKGNWWVIYPICKEFNQMAVKCVCLESDAYMVCLTHALSTEREEVMGLLIGEVLLLLFSLDNVNGQGSYQ